MTKKICGFEFILIPFKVEPTKDPRQNIHENYNKKNEKKSNYIFVNKIHLKKKE